MNSLQAQVDFQLGYYKQANAQLAPKDPNHTRVVFMGNSITEGWKQEAIALFKNTNYINRGIGGQTTTQMLGRFKQDVIELNPDVVVILAGINDIAQNTGYIAVPDIAANIKTMTQMAQDHNIQVVICSVLPANYFPWRPKILPANKVIELNQLLYTMAQEQQVTYLDYYSVMVDSKKGLQPQYTTDGVHCTLAGYKKMEELVLACLAGLE